MRESSKRECARGATWVGRIIGVGGECAFLDWLTGFIEYDYYNFSDSTNAFVCATCGLPVATAAINVTTNVKVVKAGLRLLKLRQVAHDF
jgi:hypothetical protein